MEISNIMIRLLESMDRPAFLSINDNILYANQPAQKFHILPGQTVQDMLLTPLPQASAQEDMHLTLSIDEIHYPATLHHEDGYDLFIMERMEADTALQAFAMAAQQLRIPLTRLMASLETAENPDAQRSVHQLHRAISNMSDALRYRNHYQPNLQLVDASALIDSIMESVIARQESMQLSIQYTGLPDSVICPVDEELLERAILNLIANSARAGSTTVHVSLAQQSNSLMLIIKDNGRGVSTGMRSQMFTYYDRGPSLDNHPYGLGLGMLIVQSAARAHKGTVLMEHGQDGGLKVTLSIGLTQSEPILRSPIMKIDYLGGRDHVLTELSDHMSRNEY